MAATQERYQIIERLDAGGMAEVFKAKAVSLEGFEKLVAIKKVLPGLTEDDRFTRMFLDEARLSLYLNHANIVQVFDIGHGSDGAYFIVMQFIDGANLKKIMTTLAERGTSMPMELAVFIAMDVCKGLAYAHNKRGTDGRPLGIVHRDISPPNILISREGEVKIMDFGLAKASDNLEKTDPGVVKGKFGYLSPEAAHGEEVDARTDIFAVGIVLWEMLAGRRLFLGETDFDTLQLVRNAEIPSLRPLNPDVPTELESIVRKALAREKNQRYSTSQELGSELTQFLFGRGLSVTSYDLSALVKRVIGAEQITRREEERSAIDQLIQDEINKFISLETADEAPVAVAGLEANTLFGDDEDQSTGLGMDDMWGGVFDEIQPDVALDHVPSGGTRRIEAATRGEDGAAGATTGATEPSPAGRQPSANPSHGAPVAPTTPDPTPTPDAGEAAVEEGGGNRTLWIVFGVLVALVLLAMGYLLISLMGSQ